MSIPLPFGWISPLEQGVIEAAVPGKRVLEIGTYLGRSTVIALNAGAREVVSVDPHTLGETWAAFLRLLSDHSVRNVIPLCMTSAEASLHPAASGDFDVIFIDGDHSYEAVALDLTLWLPRLVSGGLLLVHDVGYSHVGVDKALEQAGIQPGVVDHIGTWRKP